MAMFSVLLITAPPTGQTEEAGGAFMKIDGREALLRSVELFLNRDNVKQIQLAFLAEAVEEAKRKFGGHLGFSGVKVITGGPHWLDQVAAAAQTLAAEATHVIVHDAARPAVPYTDLEALMSAAAKHEAVVLTSPVRTGVIEVDEGGNALASHLPRQFQHVLMPHAFSRARFLKMAETKQEVHASELQLVKGSPLNIRVGGPGDVSMVKAMLNMMPKPKVKAPSSPFEEAQW